MALNTRKTVLARQAIGIQTRYANDVTNEFNPTVPGHGDQLICRDLAAAYPNAIPRTSGPSYGYNCHGLTFAARRTQVFNPIDVQHILREDGYVSVAIAQTLPGDIVIYRSLETRELEHSGIVVERKTGLIGPTVVSKWGASQEFIHSYNSCPYMPAAIEFYRMPK